MTLKAIQTSPVLTHRHRRKASPFRIATGMPLVAWQFTFQLTLTFLSSRLERPCMDHMQYLMVRSINPSGQPFHHPMENPDDADHDHMSGHALMATGPPYSTLMEKPAEKYPHQMPQDLDNSSLVKLLQLSSRLPLDREGEITPVMAWSMIYGSDRVNDLEAADIQRIKQDLSSKVRCYG